MIENPKKSNNLGPILRCGAAYSATFVFIGYQKCAIEGSHGANKHVEIVSFPTFQQASDFVKGRNVGSIIGILGDASFSKGDHDDDREVFADNVWDIVNAGPRSPLPADESRYPCSRPVHLRPFRKNEDVCFLISKKAIGIPIDQGKYCDGFVHISTSTPFVSDTEDGVDVMYGLIDSQTALSICLHHFAAFSGYEERDFLGQKFQVADCKRLDEEQIRILREDRLKRKEEEAEAVDDAWEGGNMANFFDI
jgi:hypothetical protein